MACRLCSGGGTRRLVLGGSDYADCPLCGFLGLAPRRFPDRAAERGRYLLHRNDPAERGYRAFLETFIREAIEPFAPPGSAILDYGSGPRPALTEILRERGWEARAYDPYFSPGSGWRSRRWRAVAVHEVAEHLRFPGRSLGAAAARLSPGGILAIRTRFAPEDEADFERWWYRLDPTHVGFFRRRSFSALARRLGLSVAKLVEPDIAVLARTGP